MFTIRARDPHSRARAGTLQLAHGEVSTPAFVPLATRGAVKTLEPRDVAALGYEMVLGNTFHLMLAPGPELVAEFGGLNEMMRWPGPIITDSGGFQVFSMGYGGVADEIKGRRGGAAGGRPAGRAPSRTARSWRSRRRGCAFAPTSTAASGSSAPRPRWPSRPRWALTSRSCSTSARRFTSPATTSPARWSAPTAGWSAACAGTSARGRPTQAVYGIVQGGTERDLRRRVDRGGRRQPLRRDRDRRLAGPGQGADVRGRRLVHGGARAARPRAPPPPARHRRDRRPDRRRAARDRHVRLRDADSAGPPRHGARARSGRPLARGPGQGPLERSTGADPGRLPLPGLRARGSPAATCTTCCAPAS